MPDLIIRPTVVLNSSIEDKKALFDQNEKMPVFMSTCKTRELSWLGKRVKELNDKPSAKTQVLQVLALFILSCTVIGIPLTAVWLKERHIFIKEKNQAAKNFNELNLLANQWNARTELLTDLDLDISKIPILDIKNRKGQTSDIDFLHLDELTQPIMKGLDAYNRPFIAFKLARANEKIVLTAFQSDANAADWKYKSMSPIVNAHGIPLILNAREIKSMLDGSHERYSLLATPKERAELGIIERKDNSQAFDG